jgi:hypothetical protein
MQARLVQMPSEVRRRHEVEARRLRRLLQESRRKTDFLVNLLARSQSRAGSAASRSSGSAASTLVAVNGLGRPSVAAPQPFRGGESACSATNRPEDSVADGLQPSLQRPLHIARRGPCPVNGQVSGADWIPAEGMGTECADVGDPGRGPGEGVDCGAVAEGGGGGRGGGGGLGQSVAAGASSALAGTIEQLLAAQKRVKALEQQLRAVAQDREGDAGFTSTLQPPRSLAAGGDPEPLAGRSQRMPSVSRNKIAPPRGAASHNGEATQKDAAFGTQVTQSGATTSQPDPAPTSGATHAEAPSALHLYRTILAIHEDYQRNTARNEASIGAH